MKDIRRILLCACALGALLRAGAAEPKVRFVPQPDLKTSGFWADRLDKLESAWIPHCWKRLGVRSGAFQRNLAEATMMALERHPDRKDLADILARFVASDVAAQRPDGYVGKCDPHYVDYGRHELYGQGYFIEAAVRHMDFTKGKDRRYFDAAIRLGNHLDSTFGPPPKRTWTDGHPGVEKALLTLADAVDRWDGARKGERYAALARYFIRHQNDIPEYRHAYCQSHEPAVAMSEAVGHAVRGTYFYAGMAGAAWRCGDAELAAAARRVFANAIDRKGYLTGGVGGQWAGEAFGKDYALPNARAYLEGCAGCGMYDWCTEMAMLDGIGRFEDVRERVVYNNLLGTFSEDFTRYAYQNPPASANPRYPWHTLPCCVGNVPRVLEDFKNRMYAVSSDGRTLYVNHFIASTGGMATVGGAHVRLDMATTYPDDGKVALTLSADRPASFTVRVRLPNRAESALYSVEPATPHGFRDFDVALTRQDDAPAKSIRFELPMPLQRVTCDARVKANRGLVAWQRGPIVFSWEGTDFRERVPYWRRLNAGGPSRVWIPSDGSAPTAETETGDWFRGTGCPLDADNRKVTSSRFLKER
ncbi:MAG: glycoside hydrolase family 127 protein [Kiritimatiellae bacterium]|nr:glycoside hydrolase family 127 protein [Kiritimatiellia bacterium]